MNKWNMLKIITAGLLLTGVLAGCAAETNESQAGDISQTFSTDAEALTETEAEAVTITDTANDPQSSAENDDSAADEERNVLVVYYSATGTTAAVANSLAELMEGDIFELEPAELYSSEDLNWSDDNSRVSQEYRNPERRDMALVAETVDNWENYDTVFIGYPIWWGIAAWPVNGFVEANDFTGKTVIPFCTSSSSGFGESGKLLEELSGTGTWLEGERFRSGTATEDLKLWIDGLSIR